MAQTKTGSNLEIGLKKHERHPEHERTSKRNGLRRRINRTNEMDFPKQLIEPTHTIRRFSLYRIVQLQHEKEMIKYRTP